MPILLFIVVGAVLYFAFSAESQAAEKREEESADPKAVGSTALAGAAQGGGVDMGKVGEAAAGVAALGGTILGALGVGGGGTAAATGGTAAAGAVAGGASAASGGTISSGGAVAGGTGGAAAASGSSAGAVAAGVGTSVSGITYGAGAVLGTSPLILGALVFMVGIIVSNEIANTSRFWGRIGGNKRRLFFKRWFTKEERAVQNFIEALSKSRGFNDSTGVLHLRDYAQTLELDHASGMDLYQYVVSSIDDAEAARLVPVVRTVARWHAIVEDAFYAQACERYWSSMNDPPSAAYQINGDWNQGLNGTGAGNNPGIREADFWRIVADYVSQQPFAEVRYPPAAPVVAATGSFAADSGGYGALASVGGDGGGVVLSSPLGQASGVSWQPFGRLHADTWERLANAAGEILGSKNYATYAAAAEDLGTARAVAICGMKDYQLFFPGEGAFTSGVAARCGLLAPKWEQKVIRTTANELRTCIIDVHTGFAIDVVGSRNNGPNAVFYTPEKYYR